MPQALWLLRSFRAALQAAAFPGLIVLDFPKYDAARTAEPLAASPRLVFAVFLPAMARRPWLPRIATIPHLALNFDRRSRGSRQSWLPVAGSF